MTIRNTRTISRSLAILVLLVLTACQSSTVEESSTGTTAVYGVSDWPFSPIVAPAAGENGIISTTDAYATEVGLRILRQGGNAVDAAVATSFALAVVNPEAGNIGGGGFMMVRLANGSTAALDYREKAPLAATRDMYLDADGNLTDRSVVGHLAAGVPGTVMGMWEAHQRFGTLTWAELVAPAVELANGVVVRERLAGSLEGASEALAQFAGSAATFLPGGAAPAVGDTFSQPDLATTLARIRDSGPSGFYAGETANLILAEMQRGGGIISRQDLAQYTAEWRDPVTFTYRGYTIVSMPPSSSGGATMAEMANMLERWDLNALGYHSPSMVHLMAEVWKRAYSDRNEYLADTDFADVPLERMISKEYAAGRASGVSMSRATPSLEVGPGLGSAESGGNTTHFSIVDAMGNAVSVTTTINSWYGSKVTVSGAGFVLNNEMDDFAAKPGTPNQFGLVQGERNAIEPGKRMLSAMTPTIVLDPQQELFMVTGTPGGATIITTVFQTISNVVDFGMNVVQAVHAPRIHHQHLPDQIFYEPGGLSDETVMTLRSLGHTVVERDEFSGDVQAIVRLSDGLLTAASDPRRGGTAIGY